MPTEPSHSLVSPLVFIGYGDIARRVAERRPDHPIISLARHLAPPPAGHRAAWAALNFDLDRDEPPATLPPKAIWLYFAPPPNDGVVDTRVARWLAAIPPAQHPQGVIYASTTGVYGDHHGEWIDEQTPANPAHDRGHRRLDAEARFDDWCRARSIPLTVLRITGIYACNRLPLERIRAGVPVVCLDESPWSNRIHADDLADICTRLIARLEQGKPVAGLFNISDNNPRPMTELFLATAAHFKLPPPPCLPLADVLAQSSPMAREFLSESKRIDASAIQRELDWRPRYPSLAAALADCRSEDMADGQPHQLGASSLTYGAPHLQPISFNPFCCESSMTLNLTPVLFEQLVDGLVEHGWYQWPHAVTDSLCQALLDEAEYHDTQGHLERAGVGRGAIHQINSSIRRDEIKWLDGHTAAQKAYLDQMAELQLQLNRSLFLGLFEYECHFALYKEGGFYKKHLDSFRGRASRMVTTVLYLNPDWQAEWGGELVIYKEDSDEKLAVITPQMGKLVVFMSEQIPHEVLPTHKPRASIAGWFRCNASVMGKIDPAK